MSDSSSELSPSNIPKSDEPKESSSLSLTILKTIASGVFHTATSSIGRKAITAGTLYFAGGVLVSSFGLGPVVAVSAAIFLP